MLISEFAKRAGLSVDTVRFYVRKGLLTPDANGKGGQRPYQVFSAADLQVVLVIRTAQSLGMSLGEIGSAAQERRAGKMTRERSIEILSAQLERLERKSVELTALIAFVRAKIAWTAQGEGPPPVLDL